MIDAGGGWGVGGGAGGGERFGLAVPRRVRCVGALPAVAEHPGAQRR